MDPKCFSKKVSRIMARSTQFRTLFSMIIIPTNTPNPLLMSQDSGELAHGLLLSVGDEDQLGGGVLGVRHIAAVESASLQLDDLVLLQSLAGVVDDDSVLR